MSTLDGWAKQANEDLGGKAENWLAIATQWVQEKGWEWWNNPEPPFNVGNVTHVVDGKVEFQEFADLNSGVWGYIHTLTEDPAGYYKDVLKAIRTGSVDDVLVALSKSPFCDPPYPIEELRGVLAEVEQHFNSTPAPVKDEPGENAAEESHETPSQEAAEETTENGEEWITVTKFPTPHSTLWGIAADVYRNGGEWLHLVALNPGILAHPLMEGQRVRIK